MKKAITFFLIACCLLPLAGCTPILLLFAILIPYLCFRNLEKHSIVERLRME